MSRCGLRSRNLNGRRGGGRQTARTDEKIGPEHPEHAHHPECYRGVRVTPVSSPASLPVSCRSAAPKRATMKACKPVFPKQNGRVAIVTGGAKGMGYETARHLTRLGMHVVIAGNSKEEGLAAVRKIQEENSKGKVEFQFLDLSSLKSVRQFVQMFKDRKLPLHILVNNAGVMLVPERQTEDGFELHFGLNYLGHFLLTNLLLDTLKQSGSHDSCARIVTVSSATHYVGVLKLEDLQSRSCYCAHGAYAQSKLALVLFSYHLQQKLTAGGFPVTVNVVDPGMVNTDLYQNLCSPAQLLKRPVAWLLFRTPAEGASTAIYAAASPTMEGVGGCYLYNGQKTQSSVISYDEDLQAQLWRQSCALVGFPVEDYGEN